MTVTRLSMRHCLVLGKRMKQNPTPALYSPAVQQTGLMSGLKKLALSPNDPMGTFWNETEKRATPMMTTSQQMMEKTSRYLLRLIIYNLNMVGFGNSLYIQQTHTMQDHKELVQQEQTQKRVRELTLEEVEQSIALYPMDNSLKLKRCCLRQGCEDINCYKRLNKIHEGQYGVVYRALQIPSGRILAIKKLKLVEGADFPITSLREIAILRSLDHPNIIKITRVAGSSEKDRVYIVMEYLDHEVKELLKAVQFRENQLRRLMRDLLEGMAYLHDRKIVHRDLKTSNLLYSNEGILKICDFGLARKATQSLMTQEVITMWYRPPQLLLGEYNYSVQLDIWSVGCIMAELVLRDAIFKGKTELQQLDLIFKVVGSPTEETWPDIKTLKNHIYVIGKKYPTNRLHEVIPKGQYGLSHEGVDLLKNLLIANPKKRWSAKKALTHVWFKGEMTTRQQMPKHTPSNQLDRLKKKTKIQGQK